jgi:hypothetical protein
MVGVSIALLGLVFVAWSSRLALDAPAEQQREAERHA